MKALSDRMDSLADAIDRHLQENAELRARIEALESQLALSPGPECLSLARHVSSHVAVIRAIAEAGGPGDEGRAILRFATHVDAFDEEVRRARVH